MGLIREFRTLQKDVAVLKDRSGDDVNTVGSGFQKQGTAGFLTASAAGVVSLGCTVYNADSGLLRAFYASTMQLTASATGAVKVPAKAGRNRLSIASAAIVTPSNVWQGSQYLSATFAWLPDATGAVYAAIARSGVHAVIVGLSGDGGGGTEEVVDVPESAYFVADGNTLSIQFTTTRIRYLGW